MIIEKSPSYFYSTPTPERIKMLGPNIKFLLVVKEPIQRIRSAFYMEYRRGLEAVTLEEALLDVKV